MTATTAPRHRRALAPALAVLGAALAPAALAAQTDYYNTDAGRPVLIEDAYPTERYAFELQLAPLRLERVSGGVYNWEVEPEVAYGILPRTHLEVGFPVSWLDAAGESTVGLAGIDVSALHNLNVETLGLPAFAVAVEATLPVGSLAPGRVYPSVKGIATRTFDLFRLHVNARYTLGPTPEERHLFAAQDDVVVVPPEPDHTEELSRWMAGVAVDKTFPLRSMLLIGNVYAAQPLRREEEVEWTAAAGVRYQLNPRLALDAGLGRTFAGGSEWFVTFGSAYAFALRSLIPVPR